MHTNSLGISIQEGYLNLFKKLSSEDVPNLSRELENNPLITNLNLGCNNFRQEEITQIVDALINNKTVKILNLKLNDLGKIGATIEIARLIQNNSVIEDLNLSINNLTNEDALVIEMALKNNHSIKTIDLSLNSISYDLEERIKDQYNLSTTPTPLSSFHNFPIPSTPSFAPQPTSTFTIRNLKYLNLEELEAEFKKVVEETGLGQEFLSEYFSLASTKKAFRTSPTTQFSSKLEHYWRLKQEMEKNEVEIDNFLAAERAYSRKYAYDDYRCSPPQPTSCMGKRLENQKAFLTESLNSLDSEEQEKWNTMVKLKEEEARYISDCKRLEKQKINFLQDIIKEFQMERDPSHPIRYEYFKKDLQAIINKEATLK